MNIKQFYIENYPTDELGIEIKENVTFTGLLDVLHNTGDVYEYVGVWDSIVRERLFENFQRYLKLLTIMYMNFG